VEEKTRASKKAPKKRRKASHGGGKNTGHEEFSRRENREKSVTTEWDLGGEIKEKGTTPKPGVETVAVLFQKNLGGS